MITISEFGLKIKNIEASTLYEYNIGVRDHYEYKDAMFVNSLFKDFLDDNGLKSHKDESTRDLICLEFNYGSRTYSKEMDHLHNVATNARKEYRMAKCSGDKYILEKTYNKRKKVSELTEIAYNNKGKYDYLTKEELRTLFYNNGVDVEYLTHDKQGNIKKREVIHYKMLFRSTGKAKKGSCMFIRDKLYKKAINFLYMGIKLPKNNAPIVEISAYAPLISSGIVGKVKINPKNILILKDVDKFFETNIISVEIDSEKHCIAKHIDNYKLKNTLFDGQALIDSSIFPDWGHGYVLLRHHFCKMAAFNTNIQKFFRDYFGDKYYTATVKDMFGNEHYVKDIELITTDNAMKWLKFDISYEYWCDRVYENGCQFGIVKTAHESKLGKYQKMSYQMVNSLDESIMENVCKESVEYVNLLKRDNNEFLKYLEKNKNFSNDYECLIYLCKNNPDFFRSVYFRDRKKKIIQNYTLSIQSGEIMQNADNLTVVGSPYAMLLYGATGNQNIVDNDDTFCYDKDTIQCYTNRFDDNEYLAFFRSPFNSKNNLLYLHNVYNEKFEKYFNFSKNIIAINMIGTDAQDRANGMDMDSDFGYTTNQADIVEHARKCYINYPTIVNNIPKENNVYNNTMDDFALVDNMLSASQTDIGESSNLAQIAQTYANSFPDNKKFDDYVSVLSVLAQVAIDSSKRRFDCNVANDIKKIKYEMNVKENKYPEFWRTIKSGFNKNNINKSLRCPMNYLCNIKFDNYRSEYSTLPMSYFFNKYQLDINRKTSKKVEDFINAYSFDLYNYNMNNTDDYILIRSDFNKLINDIRQINISKNYLGLMSWLIDRTFLITSQLKNNERSMKTTIQKNKSLMIKVLYDINKSSLLKVLSKNCVN